MVSRKDKCGYIAKLGGFKPKENEERRACYQLLRALGLSATTARIMREWRWSKIKRKLIAISTATETSSQETSIANSCGENSVKSISDTPTLSNMGIID